MAETGRARAKAAIDRAILAAMSEANGGEETEAPAAWVFHDMCRTAASGVAGLGIAPHVVEAALNHKSGTIKGVAAVYNRYNYAAEKRDALDKWAARVAVIVGSNDNGNMPSDEERVAEALAKIEAKLKNIDVAAVRSQDDQDPGLLMLLEQLVIVHAGVWQWTLALSVAFDLGRYAAGEKVSVTERQRLAGLVRAAQIKAKADAWQTPAKQIWWEKRGQFPKGDKRRKTQPQVAKAIKSKVKGVPSEERALELVEKWDREARQAASGSLAGG